MEKPSRQEFHLAQFVRDVFHPAREESLETGAGADPVDAALAWGGLLEAATLLAVGSECGEFPQAATDEILAFTMSELETPAWIPQESASRIAATPQFQLFAQGSWTEAIGFRTVGAGPDFIPEAARAFRTAVRSLRSFRSDPFVQDLGVRMMLLEDTEWRRELLDATRHLDALALQPIVPGRTRQAVNPGKFRIVDGTIRAVAALESLGEWVLDACGRDESERTPVEEARYGAVQAVARSFRWRLELTDVTVVRRWEQAVDLVDNGVRALERVLHAAPETGPPFESPWPEGFGERAAEVRALWNQLAGLVIEDTESSPPLARAW